MSDFWKGWMYAALFITATLFLGPVAVEALQWRPEDSPPEWWGNLELGWSQSASVLLAMVGGIVLVNVAFQVYIWMRRVIAEGPEE